MHFKEAFNIVRISRWVLRLRNNRHIHTYRVQYIQYLILKLWSLYFWRQMKVHDCLYSLTFFGLHMVLGKYFLFQLGFFLFSALWIFFAKMQMASPVSTEMKEHLSLAREESIWCRCPTPGKGKQLQTWIFPLTCCSSSKISSHLYAFMFRDSTHSLMSVILLDGHYSAFADWNRVFFILQILYLWWSFCSFALWGQG